MKSETLSLAHRELISGKLRTLGNGLSEYEFANLFLFRQAHRYQLLLNKGEPVGISGRTYDGASALMPLFDPAAAATGDLEGMLRDHDCLFPIAAKDLEHFDSKRFSAHCQAADADYIYRAETFKTYRGRRLAKKRNLVRQLLTACRPCALSYEPGLRKDAGAILEQWQKDTGKPVSATDYEPAREALSYARELGLFGRVYYAADRPAGYLLAGENAPGMCTIHFAKADRRIKGIYPFMFHEFARAQGGRFGFYNFEQDLGKTGFRQSKRSYQPYQLLIKYRIGLKS